MVDLTQFNAAGAVSVANKDSATLIATWSDKVGARYQVVFNLAGGQPLLKSLSTARATAADFITVAQDVDARYRVTLGTRHVQAGWPYVFFDQVDGNTPAPAPYLSLLNLKSVRVVSESPHRVNIIFSTLAIGPYVGELTFYIYDGTPLLHVQASMLVDKPWVAYIYDGLCYADFATVSYQNSHGIFQTTNAASLPQIAPGEPAKVIAKHRTIMGSVVGGNGTLAVMSPPHTGVYPTDFSDNFGWLQAGKNFIGTKMSYADDRIRPWVDAPQGATQRMDVFLLFSTNNPQATLTRVLAYTHGDFFKPIPGHYTLAEHFHPEFTDANLHGRDTLTPFKQTMQSIGVQILQPMEFHGPGHSMIDSSNRLNELLTMFYLLQANSDDNFLLIPGEEYNNFFGGHWSYMFPHPVYFTGWRGQNGREYRETNVVVGGVTYPLVYQIGDAVRMSQLLKDEGGMAWTSHPRVKDSRYTPDSFVNSDFYRDDSYQAGDWKAMPLDLSKDRLGFRGFQLMDETAQWGYRKSMLGEVDTFALNSTHEIYAHMNVNYLELPAFPSKTNWASVVECVRQGKFFTTTGELLIHSWETTQSGVTAKVEWYFPPAYAEITWGGASGVHKLKKSLVDQVEFDTQEITIAADLKTANWVRFEIWDIARDGAFSQIHWFHDPANPSVLSGTVTSFTLIDADTDAAVPAYDPIPSGAVLDRSKLPPNLTIRANTSPLIVGRITLSLDGETISKTAWPLHLERLPNPSWESTFTDVRCLTILLQGLGVRAITRSRQLPSMFPPMGILSH